MDINATLSNWTQVDLIWPHLLNTLRLTKIDALVLPKSLYLKLDCGAFNLKSFELEFNNSSVIKFSYFSNYKFI